jgi:hypothetical protein
MRRIILLGILAGFAATAAVADGTKSISGQLKSIKDKTLAIQKIGLLSKSADAIEIEMDDATKVTGQLVPGVHIKVKYREQDGRKMAIEIEARPEYASKEAKKAAEQTRK